MTANPAHTVSGAFEAKDLYSPDVIANPYPYYARLRDQPPQFGLLDYPPGTIPGQDEPHPAWVILKYRDLIAGSRNHEALSSRDPMQEASAAPTLMLVNHDRPRHTELRALAQQAFTTRRVEERLRPYMTRVVAAMVDELKDGPIDFMDAIAPVIPSRVMTHLIGTPEADWKKLSRWANAFMVTSDFTVEQRNQCNQELGQYYADKVNERYEDLASGMPPPDDMMTAFIQAEHEGQTLTRDEVIRFCVTLVVAGAETTAYLLGNLIGTLVEEPQYFDMLKNDRSLIKPFIEESIRRDGPIQRLFRVATQDLELGGARIRAGDWVALFFASGNRDPAVFEDPDRFILGRKNVGMQLTFSHGIHRCMGAGVARMEATMLLNGILDKCSAIRPGDAPMTRQRGGLLNYGLETCPIVLMS